MLWVGGWIFGHRICARMLYVVESINYVEMGAGARNSLSLVCLFSHRTSQLSSSGPDEEKLEKRGDIIPVILVARRKERWTED